MGDVRAEIDSMLDGIVTPKESVTEEVAEETTDESTDLSDDGVEEEVDEEVEAGTEDESEEEVSSVEEEEVSEGEAAEEEAGEVVEESVTEEVTDEAAGLRDQINQMAMLLQEKGIPMPGFEAPAPAAGVAPAPAQAPQTTMTLADLVIMEEGADFDAIMDSPEAFAEHQRGLLQRYSALVEQQIGRALPAIVANQVKTITALNNAVDVFYSENEDLKAVRPTVGAIADRIVAAHPDWSLEQVMAEAATTTRKVLKMPEGKKVTTPGNKKVIKPSFVKQKGTKKAPQLKISGLQKDIDDIIN